MHALKGIAGNLGLDRVARKTLELEKVLGGNADPEPGELLEQLDRFIHAIVADIDSLDFSVEILGDRPSEKPDFMAVQVILTRLATLVGESDLEAQGCFEELKALVGREMAGRQMEKLEASLDRFDFDAAGQYLAGIADTLKEHMEGRPDG